MTGAARKLTLVDTPEEIKHSDGGPIDKDGDDGPPNDIWEVHISIVENGFFVSFQDSAGQINSYVFHTYAEVNECIKAELGVKDSLDEEDKRD